MWYCRNCSWLGICCCNIFFIVEVCILCIVYYFGYRFGIFEDMIVCIFCCIVYCYICKSIFLSFDYIYFVDSNYILDCIFFCKNWWCSIGIFLLWYYIVDMFFCMCFGSFFFSCWISMRCMFWWFCCMCYIDGIFCCIFY